MKFLIPFALAHHEGAVAQPSPSTDINTTILWGIAIAVVIIVIYFALKKK